jgi:hypothetical protein
MSSLLTNADAASLHLIIDFVLYFFFTTKKNIVDTQQSAPFIDCFSNFYCSNESNYSKISCANASSFRENDAKKHAH